MPSIDDDGKYLTCRAENPSVPDSALEDKWRLDVQYQPVVTLKMGETLNPDDIKEGDDAYFECSVRANPKVYKLAWFKDVSPCAAGDLRLLELVHESTVTSEQYIPPFELLTYNKFFYKIYTW